MAFARGSAEFGFPVFEQIKKADLRTAIAQAKKAAGVVDDRRGGRCFRPGAVALAAAAKRLLGLESVTAAETGAVAAIQRADGPMRLNVREDRDGALVFHPLPAPTRADVIEVARRTAVRVERILRTNGRSLDPPMQADDPRPLPVDEPTLAAYYAAAQGISVAGERAGKPTLRLVASQDPSAKATAAATTSPSPRCAA